MSSSDSEGEAGGEQQQQQPALLGSGKARAVNRHKFKRLAERIDEVDVDVYRRVGKVRSEPLHGATSFFQETLQEWRELNTTTHWLDVERPLRPLTQSLPLLLLHKQRVMQLLLAGLVPDASVSLPPLFALLVAAARDLQEEFVPLLPDVWARFTWLLSPLHTGGGGASNDPELLQALFNAAAGLCKALVKHITAALPAALKHTKDLRYHPEHHVRCLAAEAFGFLLRAAPRKSLRAGMRALLAEHAVNPSPERAHGAGLLVAESVLGPEHGLHSKTHGVLALLLQEDLLSPQDFGGPPAAATTATAGGGGGPVAGGNSNNSKASKGLSAAALRLRCAAVAAVALERLWQHTRRGTTEPIWQVLFTACDRRLAAAEASVAATAAAPGGAAAGGGSSDGGNAAAAAAAAAPAAASATPAVGSRRRTRSQQQQDEEEEAAKHQPPQRQQQQQQQQQQQEHQHQEVALSTAAYGVLLLAQGVHYFRGSRVEDYRPFIKAADRLVGFLQQLPPAPPSSPSDAAAGGGGGGAEQHQQQQQQPEQQQQQLLQLQWRQHHTGEITWSVSDLTGLTLSHSTLQLILGITLGHSKEVGASKGLGFIKGPCSGWARVLGLAAIPQRELLGLTQGLVMPPSNAAIAELFAPQLLGALGRLLLLGLGSSSSGSNGSNGSSSDAAAAAAGCALAGLLEVCSLLQPDAAFGSASLPLLLTANPGGADLAAAVAAMAAGCGSSVAAIGSSDDDDADGSSTRRQQLLQGWAALQLLPHAAVKLEQAVEVCSSVLTAANAAIARLQAASVAAAATAAGSGSSGSVRRQGGCAATTTVGELLQLRGMVLNMLAVLLPVVAPQQLPQLATDVLEWLLQQQHQQQSLGYATVSSAAQVFEALRARVDDDDPAAGFISSSRDTTAAAAAAARQAAKELLSVGRLGDVISALQSSLVVPHQDTRAAALRLLCCFDQPSFTSSQHQQQQQQLGDDDPTTTTATTTTAAASGHERAAFEGLRCDVLCVLRDMHTQPCSIQAGRSWSVALDRMSNHLEYGRVPLLLLPALVGGLLGVLHIRFSPLWHPAAKALGEALTQNPAVTWPIILNHLTTVQQQFLGGTTGHNSSSSSNSSGHDASGGGGVGGGESQHDNHHHHTGGSSGSSGSSSSSGGGVFSLQQQWDSFCQDGRSSLAAVAAAAADAGSANSKTLGGCTDPANRLTNLLKGLAAQASAGVLEKTGGDWVPLLLALAAAVTPIDLGGGAAGGDASAAAAAAAGVVVEDGEQAEEDAEAADDDDAEAAGEEGAAPAVGAKRKMLAPPSTDASAAAAAAGGGGGAATIPQQQQQHIGSRAAKRQRGSSGLAVQQLLNRDGLGGLGFSVRAWRGVMMEWLGLLAASKAAKRLPRSSELQEAVARQLLSSDTSLQAAALKCLGTFKLPFLPHPLQSFLLQLSDSSSLRSGLIHIPSMFDQSLTDEQQQRQQQEQQQRAATKASAKKGGGGGGGGKKGQEVGRVDESIRPGFVPLLTLVLFPKMSKRSGRLGGKGAPGSARAAVLNAFAALKPAELIPLLELLLLPISGCFVEPPAPPPQAAAAAACCGGGAAAGATSSAAAAGAEAAADVAAMNAARLIPAPWWSNHLVNGDVDWWLTTVDRSKLAAQPLRRRQGFLNAFEDLLGHLGFRVQALLPPLMAITLQILEQACSGLQQQQGQDGVTTAAAAADGDVSREEGRALRSQTLRIFGQIFSRFPGAVDLNPLWPGFFRAVKPLMQRLVPEAVAAVAPPLLAATAALAAAPVLARVLANLPSQQQQQQDGGPDSMQVDGVDQGLAAAGAEGLSTTTSTAAWAVEGLGSQLLSSCFAVLSARGCSASTRDVALSVAESCVVLQPPGLVRVVLLPHTSQLLGELRASIEGVLAAAAAAAAGAGGRSSRGPRVGKGSGPSRPPKPSVLRQLALLEQLSPWCSDAATANSLAHALVALLQPPKAGKSGGSSAARAGGHGGFKRAPLDERGLARALGALAAIWKALLVQQQQQQQQTQQQSAAAEQLLQQWEVVCLLLGHLSHRESRTAAAAALAALGALIDSHHSSSSSGTNSSNTTVTYATVASWIVSLNSWSTAALDEPDYSARLGCYSQQLQAPAWQQLSRLQALPLLLQAYYDLRNESDLALRQAAATALTKAVRAFAALDAAAASQQQQQGQPMEVEVETDTPSQQQQQQQQGGGGGSGVCPLTEGDTPLRLLPRVMYPQTKVGLRSSNLSVRQEHAALLRELVLLLPGRFPDLLPLCSQDAEQDFFLNITHLQIHRRGRALQLLVRLLEKQQQQQQREGDGEGQGTGEQPAAADAAAAPRKKRRVQQQEQTASGAGAVVSSEQSAGDVDAAAVGEKRPRQQQQQQQQHKAISARVLLDIAAPLIQQFIFEGSSGQQSGLSKAAAAAADDERGGHGKKKGDSDREGAVANTAIDALQALAGHLGWEQYSGLLQRWLKLMSQYPRKQIIRAACAVLDAFHFPTEVVVPEVVAGAGGGAAAAGGGAGGAGGGVIAEQQQKQQRGVAAAASDGNAEQQQQQQDKEGAEAAKEEAEQEQEVEDDEQMLLDSDDAAAAEHQAAAAAAAAAADAADIAASARLLLQSKVLPVLQSQVVVDDAEVARAPVALAIIKVIKLLPREAERVALPRVLTSIAGLLRSRLHSSRDAAREVLADVSLELGPEYLPHVLHVLRSVLPDRGYTAHVLGYTAAALLEAHVKHTPGGVGVGQLDACVEPLLPTLEGDLFGEAAAAKDVAAFAGKYKEAKRCRAYEAYQHLAAAVSFVGSSSGGSSSGSSGNSTAFDQLLQLVRDKLPSAGSPTIRTKLEQLLTAAARGLAQNPSVTPQTLAAWIGVQLDEALRVEEAARAKAAAAVGAAVSTSQAGGGSSGKRGGSSSAAAASAGDGGDTAGDADDAAAAAGTAAVGGGGAGGSSSISGDGSAHMYLLGHFYLTVLASALKKGCLSGSSPEVLGLLDPLLPLLVRGLGSRHMGTVQSCLKCLAVCVSLPGQHLPGLSAAAVSAGKAVSSLLRKVPDAAHPLAQDCFKLLGAMLRDCPSYEPPTHHIRFLLKWIAADLQSPAGTSATAAAARAGASGGGSSASAGERVSGYGLLRAVLGRKLMLPEVYDVLDIVQTQMITSHLPPVRSTAAAALLQFLLDYPLSPSRLQGHMLFLLTNTGYEHEEGRLQALEMLQQVFLKFPPAVVANLSTTAYLPLVTRLANEVSPKARTATAATIKLLHKQLQQDSNDALAALSQQWLLSGGGVGGGGGQQQRKLRAVAAQALGLLAEVEGARFGRRLQNPVLVEGIVRQLAAAAAAAEDVLLSKAAAAAEEEEREDADAHAGPGSGGAGLDSGELLWQEVYHVLLMLEKAAQGGMAPLLWQQGPGVQQLWGCVVQDMLLYPHLWVRKAAARLLGLALGTPGVAAGLLGGVPSPAAAASNGVAAAAAGNGAHVAAGSSSSVSAGRCALLVYLQLEADVVDEGLCTQAVKCLVALAKNLAAAQPPLQQQQQIGGGGRVVSKPSATAAAAAEAAAGDGNSSSSEGEGSDDGDDNGGSDDPAAAAGGDGDGGAAAGFRDGQLTLLGLIHRMVRLAEDARYVRQQQRMAALRWIAAVVSAAGTAPFLPHLPLLLRPLYRIAEASGEQKIHAQAISGADGYAGAAAAGSGTSEDVVVLSDQVLAHLRTQFGAETLLSAYATAREEVRALRAARKTAAARNALLDPEAAARLKLRRGKKKGEARQRKAEERRRVRSARGSGGFGYKAAKGGGGGGSKKRSAGGAGGGGGGKSHKFAQKGA